MAQNAQKALPFNFSKDIAIKIFTIFGSNNLECPKFLVPILIKIKSFLFAENRTLLCSTTFLYNTFFTVLIIWVELIRIRNFIIDFHILTKFYPILPYSVAYVLYTKIIS